MTKPTTVTFPVRIRVGAATESTVGTIDLTDPSHSQPVLAEFLRTVADHLDPPRAHA
ncbi:hypothetical protein AB0J38_12170 [Streptomyces sp. NPDC050095]|uniref:hypothetical protein n=1 Tax=unclassified Streptomyces TaxID=2593676 RepID=UPI00342A17E8